MKIKTSVKSGGIKLNHNEKTASESVNSFENKKNHKKLQLKKETIKILKDSDLRNIAGGLPRWTITLCDQCDS